MANEPQTPDTITRRDLFRRTTRFLGLGATAVVGGKILASQVIEPLVAKTIKPENLSPKDETLFPEVEIITNPRRIKELFAEGHVDTSILEQPGFYSITSEDNVKQVEDGGFNLNDTIRTGHIVFGDDGKVVARLGPSTIGEEIDLVKNHDNSQPQLFAFLKGGQYTPLDWSRNFGQVQNKDGSFNGVWAVQVGVKLGENSKLVLLDKEKKPALPDSSIKPLCISLNQIALDQINPTPPQTT